MLNRSLSVIENAQDILCDFRFIFCILKQVFCLQLHYTVISIVCQPQKNHYFVKVTKKSRHRQFLSVACLVRSVQPILKYLAFSGKHHMLHHLQEADEGFPVRLVVQSGILPLLLQKTPLMEL